MARLRLRPLLAALVVVLLGAVGASPAAARQPRPFAPDGIWNAALPAHTPVYPRSAALVANLGRQVARYGPYINTTAWSTPVYRVGYRAPVQPVRLLNNDAELRQAFARVPLPADAHAAAENDANIVVWQPSTDRMWELFEAEHTATGWQARWGGAMQNVSRNRGVFGPHAWRGAKHYWGASATSLPLLGGLVTPDELRRGRINHALALALPETRVASFAWPAQRTDGNSGSADAIPEGIRFRLGPSVAINRLNLPPVTKMLARAAQRYGIIVRDRAGAVTFYAQDPLTLPANPYPALFGGQSPSVFMRAFPWSRLQAVRPLH